MKKSCLFSFAISRLSTTDPDKDVLGPVAFPQSQPELERASPRLA